MKLTRKLIPAFIMLLVSAVLMSTASFAWFAMNTEVTATGMEVTATSDAIFLEIKGSADSDYSASGTNALDASLKPVAHKSWDALADITDYDLDDDSTNDNWYYRYSDNFGVADSNLSAEAFLGDLTGYVATTTYTVKLHEGQVATGYDLYVSKVNIPANKGIKVIIAGANGYQELSSADNSDAITFNAANILSSTVTTAEQTITVYIYIDGNDTNVYTNNIANLTGEITFSLKAHTTDQNPTP